MFDQLITGEDKPSPIDALLVMLETENVDNKTYLEMPQIKVIIRKFRLYLRVEYPNKHAVYIDHEVMKLYKLLKVSYQGKSWEKVVEGIKEMKPELMQHNITEAQA